MSKLPINNLFLYTDYVKSLDTNDVFEVSTYDGTKYTSNTVTLDTLKKTFTDSYYTTTHNILDIFFKPCNILDSTSTEWPLFVSDTSKPNWILNSKNMRDDTKTWNIITTMKDNRDIQVDIILSMDDSDFTGTKYWTDFLNYGFTSRFIINPNTGHIAAPILNSSYIKNIINSATTLNLGALQLSILKSHRHYIKTINKNNTSGAGTPISFTTNSSSSKEVTSGSTGETSTVIPKSTFMVPYIKCSISSTIITNTVPRTYVQDVIDKSNNFPTGIIIAVPRTRIADIQADLNGDIILTTPTSSWKLLDKLNDVSIDKFYIRGYDGTYVYNTYTNPFISGLSNSALYTILNHYHGFAHVNSGGGIWRCRKSWNRLYDYSYYASYHGDGSKTYISSVYSGSLGTTDMLTDNMSDTTAYTPSSYNTVFMVKI